MLWKTPANAPTDRRPPTRQRPPPADHGFANPPDRLHRWIFGLAVFGLLTFLSCLPLRAQTVTFNYTGSPQTYTVPAGVVALQIQALGAGGGGGGSDKNGAGGNGGAGAAAGGVYAATAGTVLILSVGGGGGPGETSKGAYNCTDSVGTGGYSAGGFTGGAGGNPGCSGWSGGGGGGGGASVVAAAGIPVLIAGGGSGGQGGSLNSASNSGQDSTQTGALPGSAGGAGQGFGPSTTSDGGGGGGGGGGCPGGAGGSDHSDSTGVQAGTPAAAGGSCANPGLVSGFVLQPAAGGAGGAGSLASVYTGGAPGMAGTIRLTPVYGASLATQLSFPANVNAGQTVSGSLTYTNSGLGTAAGMQYTLQLPANLSAAPVIGGLPAGAAFSYAPATGVVTFTGLPATLAPQSSLGPIAVSYPQPTSGTSTVTAGATTTSPNLGSTKPASVVIGGNPVAVLSTHLAFPANVNAGQPVSGTLSITNQGPSPAAGLAYQLTLPPNLATPPTLSGLPAGAGFSYAPSSGVVTLSGLPATLAPGATLGPLAISYPQPGSATSTVTAAASTTTLDPSPAAGSASATVGGQPVADITASLTAPARVNAGQPVAVTATFRNLGPSAAAGAVFTVTVPSELQSPPTVVGLPAGATFKYDPATGLITLTGLPTVLPPQGSVGPLTLTYTQPPAGHSTVDASITTTTLIADAGGGNATATIAGAAAQVSGIVFDDVAQTGTYVPGDPLIAGATVQLRAGSAVVATTTTNAQGYYSFAGEPAGAYTVAVTPAPGRLATTPAAVAISVPGTAPSVVNFGLIPAAAAGAMVVTKTTPLVTIVPGQSIPYTITVTNSQQGRLGVVTVTDLAPAGFRYRAGSAAVNGKRLDPTTSGREFSWTRLSFAPGEKKTITLVLTAGAGITSGEFTNSASAYNGLTGTLISNVANATVRVTGDPTFDCPDVIGRVFDDRNTNGLYDEGEPGIAGVRLVTAQGLLVTSDAEGRFHIACPIAPDPALGTNFVVKLDERTLPSGYRLTTENPASVRLTAGKISKLNFGASIHRVVRVEVSDSAFEGDELKDSVRSQLDQLVDSQRNDPVIFRLAYLAGAETNSAVDRRLRAVRKTLETLWVAKHCPHPLVTEQDIVRSVRAPPGAQVPP